MNTVSSPLYGSATLAAAAALALSACGDPLVDGRYRGEPLFTLSGTVIADEGVAYEDWADGDVRISIEWSEWKGTEARGGYDVEQLETLTSFPAQFEVNIYQPPDLDALFWAPWLPGYEVAVGRPLLYLDRNQDGRWDVGSDEVIGGAFDTVLVYVEPTWEDDHDDEWGEPVDDRWDDDLDEGELYAEIGLDLHYGYQRMYDVAELCELDPEDTDDDWNPDNWDSSDWFPDAEDPVMLYVGDVDAELYFDWECDGDSD